MCYLWTYSEKTVRSSPSGSSGWCHRKVVHISKYPIYHHTYKQKWWDRLQTVRCQMAGVFQPAEPCYITRHFPDTSHPVWFVLFVDNAKILQKWNLVNKGFVSLMWQLLVKRCWFSDESRHLVSPVDLTLQWKHKQTNTECADQESVCAPLHYHELNLPWVKTHL